MPESDEKKQAEVFNYLSAITSVILGLGLTHLLAGYARLIYTQESICLPWLYTGWIVLLLPVYFIYWWAFWDYRKLGRWTFTAFSFLLIGPIGLYLITVLLLPDKINQPLFDVHAHYLNIRHWHFGLWAALQIWGILLSPLLKEGFKISSLLNRYKYAQYILLSALVVGFFNATLLKPSFILDTGILIIFWIVLLYVLSAHRRSLQTE